MSQFTKKKYVEEEVLNKYDLPSENQEIVKVLKSCGNNLHEVITAAGEQFLVSMPTRFRKTIWIKRGDFVVIEPIVEGVKVKGEISQILMKDQIRYFKNQGVWPKGFSDDKAEKKHGYSDVELFVNPNRQCIPTSSSESSSSESDEDKE